MASYAKIQASMKTSDVATFSPVVGETPEMSYEPASGTYYMSTFEVSAATGGTTVDLGHYTSVKNIIVLNKDTTNRVDGTFRTTGGSSNNQVLSADARGGMFMTGSRITVASDLVLTADTAACKCQVSILGST